MTPQDEALAELALLAGIFPEFTDMQGVVRTTSVPTQRALLQADGFSVGSDAEVREALAALRAEQVVDDLGCEVVLASGLAHILPVKAPVEWTLVDENGVDMLAQGRAEHDIALPRMPMGLHTLHLKDASNAREVRVISTPHAAPSVDGLTGQSQIWGVVAALYGMAGGHSKSLGDYDDLAQMAEVVAQQGASFLGVNPVHALGQAATQTISPYSPTHRGFLSTDHITVENDTAAKSETVDLLDYQVHRDGQGRALAAQFEAFSRASAPRGQQAFAAFCDAGGQALDDFARYEALSVRLGADWRDWSSDSAQTRIRDVDITFHKWLQWQADTQLGDAQRRAKEAGMPLGLYLDLAVGARLGGAETWGEGTAAAQGVSLGAPPDQLSPAGQNWQLSALSPRKLRDTNYAPLRQILAQNLKHCGVLRIDHALGLNRSFWIPDDGSDGGYIRQPFQALMAIIAIEATRAGTVIVGEDLGLVPEGFREQLAAGGLYGYSVLQYEKNAKGRFLPDARLRPRTLACFGTHDTPTLRGYWQGADIDWWHRLGWVDAKGTKAAHQARDSEKKQLLGLPDKSTLPELAPSQVRDKIHTKLAKTPATLVAVQLDDILNTTEAQNLPSTIDEHPNWRRRYALTIPQIAQSDALEQTASIMANAGRATQTRKDSQ